MSPAVSTSNPESSTLEVTIFRLSTLVFLITGFLFYYAFFSENKLKIDFSLEESMEYIQADEYLEVTPESIRMRKISCSIDTILYIC